MKSKIFILLFILVEFLFSCKEPPCEQKTDSFLQIGFYTLNKKTVVLTSDTVSNIYGIGEVGKSLYGGDTIVSTILIPLSQNQNTCSFVIKSRNGVVDVWDTLSVFYTHKPQLISKECGFATIFNINSVKVSKNEFDSIKVVNSAINTANEENIRIFLY